MADRKLKIDIRRGKILEFLRRDGKVSVTQLSQLLGATTVTIRNDLSNLERDGYLIRVQGGAIRNPDRERLSNAYVEALVCAQEKQQIASQVARLVNDGDVLFINSGTTSGCVAEALRARKNLNVVTNSLSVAETLGDIPTIRVLLLGGVINSQYGFTYGGDAQEQLERYQANWAILSVDGISAKGGVTTYHAEEALIDRMMLSGAKKTLIVADNTKIGRTGFTRVCDCTDALQLVTDSGSSKDALAELAGCGVKVLQP